MASPFAITAATNSIFLDDTRRARAHVTVSNTSGRPLRGRAVLVADNPEVESWLHIEGDAERSFAIAGTERYTIVVDVPDDVPAGNHSFRLDMVGEERPDEQYVKGPDLTFEVPDPIGVTDQDFPRGLVLGIAALLLIGGGFLIHQLWPSGTDNYEEPSVWARGTTCLTPGRSFDLDQGVFESEGGDLFYENVDGVERYLRDWRGDMARGGNSPLDQVSFRELATAQYSHKRFDASYGGGEVRPGTTWFFRTSEGRYAKVHILRSGQFMQFEWITYAKEGDRGELAASPVKNGACSIEEDLNCGTGQLPGDEILGFRVLETQPREGLLEVDLAFNSDHGPVIVVPQLLDENRENISGAYEPTFARQGATEVPVLFKRPGRARSAELFIYMFESGTSSEPAGDEAFICRRFPFAEQWGSS